MKAIKGYILLTRPLNLAIAFLSIFSGGFVSGSIHPFDKLLMACLSGVFIMAGANSINDYYDLDIDRINKPYRPLPSRMVAPAKARTFAIVLFETGSVLALFVNFAAFGLALFSSLLLYLYSCKLKRIVFWGNAAVAFILGLAFVYGGIAVGLVYRAVIVGIFAFLFNLTREILKDIEDVDGDRSHGIATLPIRYGIKTALLCATFPLVVLIGLTGVPYFMGIFSIHYLFIVIAGVDVFLVYVLISMWFDSKKENMKRLSYFMKLDMLICLLAVFVGS